MKLFSKQDKNKKTRDENLSKALSKQIKILIDSKNISSNKNKIKTAKLGFKSFINATSNAKTLYGLYKDIAILLKENSIELQDFKNFGDDFDKDLEMATKILSSQQFAQLLEKEEFWKFLSDESLNLQQLIILYKKETNDLLDKSNVKYKDLIKGANPLLALLIGSLNDKERSKALADSAFAIFNKTKNKEEILAEDYTSLSNNTLDFLITSDLAGTLKGQKINNTNLSGEEALIADTANLAMNITPTLLQKDFLQENKKEITDAITTILSSKPTENDKKNENLLKLAKIFFPKINSAEVLPTLVTNLAAIASEHASSINDFLDKRENIPYKSLIQAAMPSDATPDITKPGSAIQLLNIIGNKEVNAALFNSTIGLIEKVTKYVPEGDFSTENSVTNDELKAAANAFYQFMIDSKASEHLTGVQLYEEKFAAGDKFTGDAINLGLKIAPLLLDTEHLKERKEIFNEAINNIFSPNATTIEMINNAVAVGDIFIERLRSKEGSAWIKHDLIPFIKNNEQEVLKLFNQHMPDDINVKKLKLNNDRIIKFLSDEKSYGDLLDIYHSYSQGNKYRALQGSVKLLQQNSDFRSIVFNTLKNAITTFIRDSIYPGFVKRALINKICGAIIKQSTNIAANSGEIVDLNNLLDLAAKKSHFSLTKYAFTYCEFSKLHLQGIEFKNIKMKGMSFAQAKLGSQGNGLVLDNCVIKDCNFKDIKISGGKITITNSAIDAKSFLSLLPAIKELGSDNIKLENIKFTNAKLLTPEQTEQIKEVYPQPPKSEKTAHQGRQL